MNTAPAQAAPVAIQKPARAALEVRNLWVRFGEGGGELAVVRGVDFEIYSGEIVGLVGESGSGKTLTGAALIGMLPAVARQQADAIRIDGRELTALDEPAWRRLRGPGLAMIFQDPLAALDPVLTIGSQLSRVFRRHRAMNGRDAFSAARAMLENVGLDASLAARYPHELSGGMRQRVVIAMAMACRPRVLIADEPTTALDVTSQAQILALIRNLAADIGSAVLLITHDLGLVAQSCDRALVMHAGRIIEEGPVLRLFEHPGHDHTAALLAAVPRLDAQNEPA